MDQHPTPSLQNIAAAARAIIDANDYMTLATADAEGSPWASPVWYAHDDYTVFLWISRPETLHSRNLAEHPQVGIVIFDSTVPPGQAQAVYVRAIAEEVTGGESLRTIAGYSRRSVARGAGEFRLEDVTAPSPMRLYKAWATELSVLGHNDQRIPLEPTAIRSS
jgi:hypothetical protein